MKLKKAIFKGFVKSLNVAERFYFFFLDLIEKIETFNKRKVLSFSIEHQLCFYLVCLHRNRGGAKIKSKRLK